MKIKRFFLQNKTIHDELIGFLFAELGAFWDKTSSEAIDKAISVLMNYFEWSLKDPKSSEVEFKKLVSEIHATKETRDISNLVTNIVNKLTCVSS